jgi:hypothetical protein
MPDTILNDLAEGFQEAVWCYHEWTPSLRESEEHQSANIFDERCL